MAKNSHRRRVRIVGLVVGAAVGLTGGHFIGEAAAPYLHHTPAAVSIPARHLSPPQAAAAANVFRVVNDSPTCKYTSYGSGWPDAPDYIVTNAHVVSGSATVGVDRGPGTGSVIPGEVVFFDPVADVAVLHVPGLNATPLEVAASAPADGTKAVGIGYPLAGPESVYPAAVSQSGVAQIPNIYDTTTSGLGIELLAANVQHGDSGGPLVGADGRVVGIVFRGADAKDTVRVGAAIAPEQFTADLEAAAGRTAPVETSQDGHSCVS